MRFSLLNIPILLLLLFSFNPEVFSQCDESFRQASRKKLDDGYSFLKDFHAHLKISRKKKAYPKMRYSVLLSKGTNYKFFAFDSPSYQGKLVLELHNKDGKVFSNFEEKTQKYLTEIPFTCKRTGVYYLVISFREGEVGCGMAVMSFENKNN